MKLNIADPSTGAQKLFDIEDELRTHVLMEKRLSAEIAGDALDPQFNGYVFKITGGSDKQGFPMKQGVLVPHRVRLLMSKGHSCFRARRKGERKRKSVRGCIISNDIAVVSMIIVKKGPEEIPGLTDTPVPKRLGPKRASRIRKLFNLSKEEDVRKYVIRRELPAKEGKKAFTKAPKIQRLITPVRLRRKRAVFSEKRRRETARKAAAEEYKQLLAVRQKERRDSKAMRRLAHHA